LAVFLDQECFAFRLKGGGGLALACLGQSLLQALGFDRFEDVVDEVEGEPPHCVLRVGSQGNDKGWLRESLDQIQAVVLADGEIEKKEVHLVLVEEPLRGCQSVGLPQKPDFRKLPEGCAKISPAEGFILH